MNDIYDIIIIGGGPAGISAGIYSSRAGYNTLLFENIGFGGQMMLTDIIDNYPGFPEGITGFELQEKMVKHMKKFGIKTSTSTVTKIENIDNIFIIHTDQEKYKSYSVIIATGAKHRILNIPGEKKFAAKGVSYCGTCDGPFFKDKDLIVIGGGDTALSEAIFLSKFAKSVTIIHRRDRFRAVQSLVEQANKNNKISFLFNHIATEIKGSEKVESILIKDLIKNDIYEKKIDGIFIFIGLDPNTNFIDKSLLDENNYIITDCNMQTKKNGIFAAGDVRSGTFRQIICATSNGATASEYAGKYVDELKGIAYK